MKYYLIAGEASGDLHGSALVAALKHRDPSARFRGFGGNLMQQQGVELAMHYNRLAFMGFSEVIRNLPAIFRNFRFCKRDIIRWKPDAVILIDYPGFNLRMAKFIHSHGIKVIYYISPQLWAWHESRVQIIRRYVDKMLVILPFEKDFYARHGMEVTFTGHPLLDVIARSENVSIDIPDDKPIIALLPGSRKQEIAAMLPVMIKMVSRFADYRFVIAGAPSVPDSFYRQFNTENLPVLFNQTYQLLRHSKAAIVTSGTATLETALHSVPLIVCYKGNAWSYRIAKRMVKVKYISLVNLIMDQPVVCELIQSDMNENNMQQELHRILTDRGYRDRMLQHFEELKNKLGSRGASERAAAEIISMLNPAKG